MYGSKSSIWDDIRYQFRYGTMVNKLLLANGIFYVVILLVWIACNIIKPGSFQMVLNQLGVSHDWHVLLKPWSLITYMFTHERFFHILFNLIGLYIFGFAFNTFFSDRQLLGVYILGGLAGAVSYMIFANLLPHWHFGEIMIGASASVTAILFALTAISPDYEIRLLLLGNVKIKYIALAFVLFDLVGIASLSNTGGHFAHLGGGLLGFFYVKQLQVGSDWTKPINKVIDKIVNIFKPAPPQGPRVVYRNTQKATKTSSRKQTTASFNSTSKGQRATQGANSPMSSLDIQARLDEILDKIGESGYDSLSKEEKDFLFRLKDKDK